MCHERWTRRERREERFEEELRFLLDEHERREPPAPVVERDGDYQPMDPERPEVEATRA